MARALSYCGILPALPLPLRADGAIDEQELRALALWLAGVEGVGGVLVNGLTGEVFALDSRERQSVVLCVADALRGRVPTIAGICADGLGVAIEHGVQAKEAGADALLVMPQLLSLRFPMTTRHVVDHFVRLGEATGLDQIVHVYPAWTKASYACETLAELARLPRVRAFKIGTREMNKYALDIRAIREVAPEKAILTAHDEYLLPTMLQGVDGALIGLASFIPELCVEVHEAVRAGDLPRALAAQARIDPIKDVVYGAGEPSGDAHARMKYAMVVAGRLKSPLCRPPFRAPEGEVARAIERVVRASGMRARSVA